MNLVLDANILVRCIVGRGAARQAAAARDRGIELVATIAQLDEAVGVLTRVFGVESGEAAAELLQTSVIIRILDDEDYRSVEQLARERLHSRGQPDWPTLAAALALDGEIWTDDRDFFGVGVPVWSTPNLRFAAAA